MRLQSTDYRCDDETVQERWKTGGREAAGAGGWWWKLTQ